MANNRADLGGRSERIGDRLAKISDDDRLLIGRANGSDRGGSPIASGSEGRSLREDLKRRSATDRASK
ncbi:MAG: hypothetical protein LBO72_02695 [Helicobacteraceae bacterium]|nr:hypothetical protein [Helicobacteraceae bacterium]